ncbi:MAG: S8 family serine peptidase [Actinobacteria bacterium]|nr:S8 family serine peptidase [Actinomycetota bacterium]
MRHAARAVWTGVVVCTVAAAGFVGAGRAAAARVVVGTAPGLERRFASATGAAEVRRIPEIGAAVVTPGPGGAAALLRRLRASRAVRYAELERPMRAYGRANEADVDPGRGDQWGLDAIGAPTAWQTSRGGGVVVAVVDTGVAEAPDLEGQLLPGWNAIDGTDDATDDNGHGTHVAGTIAEIQGNGIAEAGVAPDARILPVKVLDASGSGSDATVAAGIVWAADNGAQVINLSLGGPERSRVLADAVKYATRQGALVVAAAGNDGGAVGYPAKLPGVLSVGAVGADLAVPGFSNRGAGLDIVAPGVGIVQQTIGRRQGTWANNSLDGTSMAAPHVSAVAALVIAARDTWTPATVARRLTSTAQDLGAPGRDDSTGYGLIRADLAVTP